MAKQSAKNISFATFNLYNLQLPEVEWHKKVYSQAEYAEKIKWSAATLIRLDADVIAFQELWSKQCLVDLFEAAGLEKDYTLCFIKDEWYNIAVAAAVRKPWQVIERKNHKDFPSNINLSKPRSSDGEDDELNITIDRFSRTVLQLSINHEDAQAKLPTIEVLITHLKSKLPTVLGTKSKALKAHQEAIGSALSTIRRTSEAAALRVLLTTLMKGTDQPVVVLGDLNDGVLSNTLSIITQQPPSRMYESSRVGNRNDAGLYTASLLQQMRSLKDAYYTHEFKGIQEVIDHVLVSEQFYDHSDRRVWSFREMRVWNDYLEDDDNSSSDHGVVSTYFLYDPK
ncbi:MAG: nuclease [Leptolyngbya foveolarum]|uniref:Nuclease n=1 Tax=Leptolyngbya foveolarum TaxID=47253 RepID=A0A2W4VSM2_9CYAN|nr:MAG: nuclease [Leptolyngbya foveolarum]